MLKKNEVYIDALPLGSLEYGVMDSFELGFSSLLYLGAIPNFSLKHRMFHNSKYQTTFNSFTFFIPYKDLENEDKSFSALASMHGINTSFYWEKTTVNIGFYHLYSQYNTKNHRTELGTISEEDTLTSFFISFGVDYLFSHKWAFSCYLLTPFYTQGNHEGSLEDGHIELYGNSTIDNITLSASKFALIRAWKSFAFEFGLYRGFPVTGTIPYISGNWRF